MSDEHIMITAAKGVVVCAKTESLLERMTTKQGCPLQVWDTIQLCIPNPHHVRNGDID